MKSAFVYVPNGRHTVTPESRSNLQMTCVSLVLRDLQSMGQTQRPEGWSQGMGLLTLC